MLTQQLYLDDETDTLDPSSHQPLHLQGSETPDLIQLLLGSLHYRTTPDTIPPEITEEEYRGKLKAWDKCTTTSPISNMHLSHLRAYWAEHTLAEGTQEANTLEETRKGYSKVTSFC